MSIEELLETPVNKVGFTPRTTNLLLRYNIIKLKTVIMFTEDDYKRVKGFGGIAIRDIKNKISLLNIPEIHLGMTNDDYKKIGLKGPIKAKTIEEHIQNEKDMRKKIQELERLERLKKEYKTMLASVESQINEIKAMQNNQQEIEVKNEGRQFRN